MVLIAAAGWLLERFAGLQGALLPAVFVGFLVANFVPTGGACAPGAAADPGEAARRGR